MGHSSLKKYLLLTEFLFGFVEALLPTRTLVRFREHNRYILNSGSVNKVRMYNMSHAHVSTTIESSRFRNSQYVYVAETWSKTILGERD